MIWFFTSQLRKRAEVKIISATIWEFIIRVEGIRYIMYPDERIIIISNVCTRMTGWLLPVFVFSSRSIAKAIRVADSRVKYTSKDRSEKCLTSNIMAKSPEMAIRKARIFSGAISCSFDSFLSCSSCPREKITFDRLNKSAKRELLADGMCPDLKFKWNLIKICEWMNHFTPFCYKYCANLYIYGPYIF